MHSAPNILDREHFDEVARMTCDCEGCGGDGCTRPSGDCVRAGIAEALEGVASESAKKVAATIADRLVGRMLHAACDLLEIEGGEHG